MTWEETIIFLRDKPEYSEILYQSYLNDDLNGNVERFRISAEFISTLDIIRDQFPGTKKVLELGSGTGMAAAALALSGYSITATDPDPSDIVGCGSIQKLKDHYSFPDFSVIQTKGEHLPFESATFDLVYVRQVLHHAFDLKKLIQEACRVMKKGAGFIAVREHIIFSEEDKNIFLSTHPLQSWYGGENAYLNLEYTKAIKDAGLHLDKTYKYYDSVINYFPMTENELNRLNSDFEAKLNLICSSKFGYAGKQKVIQFLYRKVNELRFGSAMDERRIPGRMYSYVAHKQ